MLPLFVADFTTLFTVAGLGFYLVALWSARSFLRRPRVRPDFAPGVSILKPLRGIDPSMAEAFASHCRQQYSGEYEILFGVSSMDDPAAAVVRDLQTRFPAAHIRLILCADALGPNGKVSNVAQLVPHARHDYLVINDSDIRVGPHYLAHIMAPFAREEGSAPTGLVTCLYRGITHGTIGSRLEALGISTDFAAGVLTARYLERGLRFGLGSTLAVSREALDTIGGIEPLTEYLADDYHLGARIHAAGYEVALASEVVETSIPAWSLRGFVDHQLRWLRTMRDSRKTGYAGLVFSYGLAWALLNFITTGLSLPAFALFSLALFLRISLALVVGVGILNDRRVLRDLWMLLPRDLIAIALWAWSYASKTVTWRGEDFSLEDGKIEKLEPEPVGAER